jgi:hypothetical protein
MGRRGMSILKKKSSKNRNKNRKRRDNENELQNEKLKQNLKKRGRILLQEC